MPLDTGILFLSLFVPFGQLGWLGIAALLGGYSGIYLFLRGFRMLQHKRLILNTPLSKIRSASMGLVEVSGMAKGPQTIRAGITGEPCYYYRARAWQESDSGNRRTVGAGCPKSCDHKSESGRQRPPRLFGAAAIRNRGKLSRIEGQ